MPSPEPLQPLKLLPFPPDCRQQSQPPDPHAKAVGIFALAVICHLLGAPDHPQEARGKSRLNHQAKQLQSDPLQVNHPKFREQDHDKEADVEEEQAEAVRLAELETLKRDRDQGEDQAEPQGAGQHPHQ